MIALANAAVPEQIHIAYTGVVGQLSVDFVSSGSGSGSIAWGTTKGSLTSTNTTTSFSYPTIGYLHQGLMTFDVTVGQKAYYQVSAAGESSAVFEVTPVVGAVERFAVFGDFGLKNDVCMNDLIQEAAAGSFDSVLHAGDWAYNFEQDTGCGATSCVGNSFMNLMQGYAAVVPVMPAAGNHEACGACPASPINPDTKGNFSEYRSRLHSVTLFAGANAGTNNNIYYSFNQGITHFIVFSAEAYIYAVDQTFLANQLAFMAKDLAAVDRKVTPWVVAIVHKDWTMEAAAFKDFAPILEKGGVDILFCGHVHNYRRYAPYDSVTGTVDSASVSADGKTYTNPKYMAVIVTGASGDREDDSKCGTDGSPSLTCTQNYGYLIFTPVNGTVATSSFHTVKADGPGPNNFSDDVTIITDHRVSSL